ncbi:hypothetical protein PROFUN_04236 [Planoprotostelium fungivorum]|uniref:THH1/TOM1/TOM3 domain-containing protein n=1 Tax=Planoprotostelium fungivorum TaxID=1890364 RepID=A0A2P6NW08_9EUKA|nr:hypothetical protein PROFUN_04236 [Planoprotostelium fungivorum]
MVEEVGDQVCERAHRDGYTHWDMLFSTEDFTKYDTVHFILAASYIGLSCLSAVLFIRLLRTPSLTFSWQRIFHPILGLGSFVRAVFFVLQPFVVTCILDLDQWINNFLNVIASFFFVCCYLILLFLWVEIYHKAAWKARSARYFKPLFLGIVVTIFIVLFILQGLDRIMRHGQREETWMKQYPIFTGEYQIAIVFFLVLLYISIGIGEPHARKYAEGSGFLVYGVMVWRAVTTRSSAGPSTRRQIKQKIVSLTVIINICFMIRAALIIFEIQEVITYGLQQPKNMTAWYWDAPLYLILEVVSLLGILWILRSAPKKREESTSSPNHSNTTPNETTPLVNP